MNSSGRVLWTALFFVCSAPSWGQDQAVYGTRMIRGRVVDADGKPVAGVLVGGQVGLDEDTADPAAAPRFSMRSVKTDAEGKFAIERTFHGAPSELIARDEATKRGGFVIVDPKNAGKPVEISIGKLVRLRGVIDCKDDTKRKVLQSFAILFMGKELGSARHGYFASNHQRFDMLVPPGDYSLMVGGEGGDYVDVIRRITIKPYETDVDLGTISLPLKAIVKLKGKPAPRLHVLEARGVPKTVQVADYKGKWVLLYFWGFWCQPCVRFQMPRLMAFNEDYAAYRDQFVILTIHTGGARGEVDLTARSLAEYDKKIEQVITYYWYGHNHPFPVLIDDDPKSFTAYSIDMIPTPILIDPSGNVVGQVDLEALAAKFPKPPLTVILPRMLERKAFFPVGKGPLRVALKSLGEAIDQEITFASPESEKKADLARLPYVYFMGISLRSAFELLLDPFDLQATIGPKGYVISLKDPSAVTSESAVQKSEKARIERILAEPRARISLEFENKPLEQALTMLQRQMGMEVLLDPRAVLNGKIDPRRLVSSKVKDASFGQALNQFAKSLGLKVAIRDEVILLEPK